MKQDHYMRHLTLQPTKLIGLSHRFSRQGLPHMTRLPLPWLTIDFGESAKDFHARLVLHDGLTHGRMVFSKGHVSWSSFVHSEKNVLCIRLCETGSVKAPLIRISDDHFDQDRKDVQAEYGLPNVRHLLKTWGYPEPVREQTASTMTYFQEIPGNGAYAIAVTRTRKGGPENVLVSATFSRDAKGVLARAKDVVEKAAALSQEALLATHLSFWHDFWERSYLTIPDSQIEGLFYVEMYKLGCSSRAGKLPCTLQGP